METPLSTRRVTRSQTAAASASSVKNNTLIAKRSEESDSKSRQRNNGKVQQQETTKNALLDITNNSPIVGLAMGNLLNTPSSSSSCFAKKSSSRRKISRTPGSGEALLRDQVKTLLQKVEEEAELSKVSVESRPLFHHHHHFQGFVHSPMGLLLAPTPTNTPQVLTTSEGLQTATFPDTAADVNLIPSKVVNPVLDAQQEEEEEEEEEEESIECQKSQITRSLLLDFSDKSEVIDSVSEEDCSSELTAEQQGEDSASAWSVQVNASSTRDEDEVIEFDENVEEEEEDEEEADGGWSVVDELCLGIENMGIRIAGKHKRFVYNSDDEMVAKEEEEEEELNKLKGLPTPKGKHIRFDEEEEEEEDEEKEDAATANNNNY